MLSKTLCSALVALLAIHGVTAIIYDKTNVVDGELPPPLRDATVDFNIIQLGAGTSGGISAPLLVKSNCLKVLVLDEGDILPLDDLYSATRPGQEYWTGGYYQGEIEKMSDHTGNVAIDDITNRRGMLWRTIPGGAGRLSHYAWEYGDAGVHERDMYRALGNASEWSVQNTFVTIPNRRLKVVGPNALPANHANQGLLRVQESRDGPFQSEWLNACTQFTGYPVERDFLKPTGSIRTCGAEPSNIRADGFRSIPENEYLIPEASRNTSNLVYIRGVSIRRILFEGTTAVGVQGAFYGVPFSVRFATRITLPRGNACPNGHGTRDVKEYKKILLSAGTIGNAQILKLSGVGPRAELANFNIKVVVDNPHVGAHFKEGLVSYLGYSTNATRAEVGYLPNGGIDAITSRPAAFVEVNGTKYLFLLTPSDYFGVSAFALVFQLEQTVEGSVTLKSGNPEIYPRVNYGWNEDTIQTHIKGLRHFRRLIKETSLKSRFAMVEKFPGGEPEDDAGLTDAIRRGSEAILHAVGTTRMALSKSDGVVNTNFEVFDTQNLMVSSMSVMRYFPGAGGQHWAVVIGDIVAQKILTSLNLPTH